MQIIRHTTLLLLAACTYLLAVHTLPAQTSDGPASLSIPATNLLHYIAPTKIQTFSSKKHRRVYGYVPPGTPLYINTNSPVTGKSIVFYEDNQGKRIQVYCRNSDLGLPQ